MRVAKWTGILGFVVILLVSPLAVAAQAPVTASRAVGVAAVPLAFTPSPPMPFPDAGITLTGDFTRDGKLDFLVVGSSSDGVARLYTGNGDGTFARSPLPPFPLGARDDGTRAADVNGDGLLDLVTAHAAMPYAQLGNGDGTFRPGPGTPPDRTPETSPGQMKMAPLLIGDMNGDGRPDAVVWDGAFRNPGPESPGAMRVYLGEGDGGFREAPGGPFPTNESNVAFHGIGDQNGDGALDIITSQGSRFSGSHIMVYLGDGRGGFMAQRYSEGAYTPVTVADFNRDGLLDIVTLGAVRFGSRDGSFVRGDGIESGQFNARTFAVDFDGDSVPDLLMYGVGGRNALGIQRNDGAGHFASWEPLQREGATARAVGDFNGDGRPDILTQDNNTSLIFTLLNTAPRPAPQPLARTIASPVAAAAPNVAPAARAAMPLPPTAVPQQPPRVAPTTAPAPPAPPLPNPAPPRR